MSDTELNDLEPAVSPPPELEERVVRTLAGRGLLRRGSHTRPRPWAVGLAAAASLLLIITGGVVGRMTASPDLARAEFMLLLYQGPEFDPYTDENFAERFDDFSRWIAALRAGGHFVGGEALDSTGVVVLPEPDAQEARLPTASDGWIDGVLMINATDYDEAVALARSSPHVRYGGRIAVRRVSPT